MVSIAVIFMVQLCEQLLVMVSHPDSRAHQRLPGALRMATQVGGSRPVLRQALEGLESRESNRTTQSIGVRCTPVNGALDTSPPAS
jgi:DNA-binding FadR family transcriptional regulator